MTITDKSRPFGIATKRFAKVGFHPNLDLTGCMKKDNPNLGPGQYNPKEYHCSQKKNKVDIWTLKREQEEFSKFLGFRNPQVLEERDLRKTMGGPGTYDIQEPKCLGSIKENTGFGTQPRFQTFLQNIVPPPDTYLRNIFTKHASKSFNTKGHFEWDGKIDRFKSSVPEYQKAPNRYNPIDRGNIDSTLKKVVSLKGPYNLFTGPRDGTTIKNHFSPPNFRPPENFYIKPSDLDCMLTDPQKSRYGKFLKDKRFPKRPTVRMMLNDISMCYKNPNDPSPAHYNVESIGSIKPAEQAFYPFASSQVEARPGTQWKIHPGPGRYSPVLPQCRKKKRKSWVFMTRYPRSNFAKAPESYRAF